MRRISIDVALLEYDYDSYVEQYEIDFVDDFGQYKGYCYTPQFSIHQNGGRDNYTYFILNIISVFGRRIYFRIGMNTTLHRMDA